MGMRDIHWNCTYLNTFGKMIACVLQCFKFELLFTIIFIIIFIYLRCGQPKNFGLLRSWILVQLVSVWFLQDFSTLPILALWKVNTFKWKVRRDSYETGKNIQYVKLPTYLLDLSSLLWNLKSRILHPLTFLSHRFESKGYGL